MTIHVDLTTKNTVYNPLSAQGQWINHRFGRRNYPSCELDYADLAKYLQLVDDNIFLISAFGDPLCYANISDVVRLNKNFIIHTYLNIKNDELMHQLADSNSTIAVKLAGIEDLADKIYLNSNWETIYNNLSIVKDRALIEFELFEHNGHQIPKLLDICNDFNIKLKITPGTSLNGRFKNHISKGYSSIIDQHGEWLYDVITENTNTTKDFYFASDIDTSALISKPLVKTVQGFLTLRTFVKPIKGRTILNRPLVLKTSPTPSARPLNGFSIGVSGHILPNQEITKMFSNMLCDDWQINPNDITGGDYINKYLLDVANLINQINNLDLRRLHYSNEPEDVLSYLSNSNI